MENFTPISALLGGALIGLAASLLIALNGRIAGVSSIMNGVFLSPRTEWSWRSAFLCGLILATLVVQTVWPEWIIIRNGYPLWLVALGGYLVGFGTRLGSGCTSGHGICGLAQLSIRSLTATAAFMTTGMLTVFVVRHIWTIAP